MKSHLVIVLALLLLWTGGCARRPAPPGKFEPVSADQLAARMQARAAYWRTYQARLQIKGESPKGKFRFQSVVLSQLPDAFRLEAYTTWGQTAGVLIIDKRDAQLWVPAEKVVYTAGHAEDLVAFFLGVPIPLEVFGYTLIAAVPPEQMRNWQVRRDSAGWLAMARTARQDLGFTWQFLADPPALQAVKVSGQQSDYTVSYDPAVGLDPQSSPAKISFSSPQWRMEVSVSQMQTPRELQPSLFTLSFPDGTRRVTLDQVQ